MVNLAITFFSGTWAGVDSIFKELGDDFRGSNFPVCRFANSSFSQLIAEYVISNIIGHERGFRTMYNWQKAAFWPEDQDKILPRSVNEMTIGILGYGHMGKSIAKIAKVSKILTYCKSFELF